MSTQTSTPADGAQAADGAQTAPADSGAASTARGAAPLPDVLGGVGAVGSVGGAGGIGPLISVAGAQDAPVCGPDGVCR